MSPRRLSLRRLFRRPCTIDAEAARWSDQLCDGNVSDAMRQRFQAWYAADPAHAQAFDEIERAYRLARAAGSAHALRSMEREIVLRVAHERRRRRNIVATTAVLLVAATATFMVNDDRWQYWPEELRYRLAGDRLYRTDIGERLSASLPDGSQLTLNTSSRAVVRYSDERRDVTLMHGQALFEVARDSSRPFTVTAGERRLTALGTAFDVRLLYGGLAVTLLEGRVAVSGPTHAVDHSQPEIELLPGEQFLAVAHPPVNGAGARPLPVIRDADLRRVVSWRDGQVIFEDDRLIDAVNEINRYARRRVVLADEHLADLRISGAFSTSDTGVFLRMVMLHLPVAVVHHSDDRIVLGYAHRG